MTFSEKDVFSTALIGFDMIDGPFLKWKEEVSEVPGLSVDLDEFAVNFYLAFKGGNGGLKPRAIMYDKFSIVAFPRGLELCCVFTKPPVAGQSYAKLQKIADRTIAQIEARETGGFGCEAPEGGEGASSGGAGGDDSRDVDEVKRILVNLLRNTQMSTPELGRYFQLTSSQTWKIIAELEAEHLVARCGKRGRAVLWTSG
ncbi:MAG: hypothetical protein ACTSU5_04060 [Promethearchaeota archaeon]